MSELLIPLSIFSKLTGWMLSGVGTLILLVVAWMTKSYILPILKTDLRRKMAQYILLIADEVTDYFAAKYPDKKAIHWIDDAIDKIIEITGTAKEVATRAALAATSRKSDLK
ncbi:MAG TPA: hypothetical protein VGB01_00255 [candidate division Zixibacteria bacterium]